MMMRLSGSLLLVLLVAACTGGGPADVEDDVGRRDTGADDVDASDDGDGPQWLDGDPVLDPYGGDERVALEATGFFRLEELCGRYWLVTPLGHPTLSFGVNSASPRGGVGRESGRDVYLENVDEKYESWDEWADESRARLFEWGLNTAGSWSAYDLMIPRMPTTPNLRLSGGDWYTGQLADWFSEEWVASVEARIEELVLPYRDEPNVMGFFLDNEMRWGADWRGGNTLLQEYLGMSAERAGKARAVDFLLEELGGLDGVNEFLSRDFASRQELLEARVGWSRFEQRAEGKAGELVADFLTLAAERYFSVTTSRVRAAAPNHLILGNRDIASLTRQEVLDVAARHVDVLSINHYTFIDGVVDAALQLTGAPDPGAHLENIYASTGLPILITEFGYRAADSGHRNSFPPIYPTFETQTERADAFETYARAHLAQPHIVGYHWFRWVDQPFDGRVGDGENNNFGLVSLEDERWEELVQRMQQVNTEAFSMLCEP